jgi:hypothetical protein
MAATCRAQNRSLNGRDSETVPDARAVEEPQTIGQGWRMIGFGRKSSVPYAGREAVPPSIPLRADEVIEQGCARRRTSRNQGRSARNYADDFVILSRGCAAEAKAWAAEVMSRLGLELNETKTCCAMHARSVSTSSATASDPAISLRV